MHAPYFAAADGALRKIGLWRPASLLAAWNGTSGPAPLATPAGGGRDVRLDLFRGLALWFIFLDHIPGNIASWITVRNYGFSDATEIFVFISGYTAALVYGKAMREDGAQASARILKRAWQIYIAHVVLFLIYAAAIAYVAVRTGNSRYIDRFGLIEFVQQPGAIFMQLLLLRFKPANMDVLPMYVVVLAAFPPTLWLLVRRPGLALAASAALYGLARNNDWSFASHTGGAWMFNPFAWQLLFVFGAWCALGGAARLAGLIRSRPVAIAATAYLAFAFAITMTWRVPALADLVPGWLAAVIYPIDKPNLDVLRIAHFLALAVLVVRLVRSDAPILTCRLLRPVVRCGMHSLEIFCLGVLLSFLAHAALVETSGSAAMQVVISAAGISLLIAAATLLAWADSIEGKKRSSTTVAAVAMEPVKLAAIA